MKVSIDKKYTSNGKPIRILCTDRNNRDYPVVGLFDDGYMLYFLESGVCPYGEEYNLVEVWEPQVGEWCLFWDYEKSKTIFVSCFLRVDKYGKFQCKSGITWNYCAKFTGELPKHLKAPK
jgi:hypothetical protein